MAQALVLQAFKIPNLRIVCVREVGGSLLTSAKKALEEWIRKLELPGFKINIDGIYHENGSSFAFEGASTQVLEQIRGWEGVNRCWFEEAHMMSSRSRDLLYPTIFRQPDSEFWATFNPRLRTDPIYQDFVSGDFFAHDRFVHHVNFNDNPWFPEAEELLRAEWERTSPHSYAHVWLGVPDDGSPDAQILPYSALKACVEAYELGLMPPRTEAPITDMGLDISYGSADLCAQVIRIGPCVEFAVTWPGVADDVSDCARRCHDNSLDFENQEKREIQRLYYDASSPMATEFQRLGAEYSIVPVWFGGGVGGPEVLYERRRQNQEVFARRNIQMADALRLRAFRTVRLLKGDKEIDPVGCLFINPNIPKLDWYLGQLMQPIRRLSPGTGKWEMDKTGPEERRGDSPDLFDATCLAFAADSDKGLKAGRGVW